MPKHGYYSNSPERLTPKKKELHPVWRGVGFSMFFFVPFISIISAIVLVNKNIENKWIRIPSDMLIRYKDPYILVKAGVAFVIGFALFALFTLITFLANRFWGPPRYGPFDVPSEEFKPKKK